MKNKILSTLIVVLGMSAPATRSQGTFQNLNFEEAQIVPVLDTPFYPYAVTVADALPGWTVYYGTVQQTQILYNAPTVGGTTAVVLYALGYQSPGAPPPVIDGNFSVLLQGGVINGASAAASISQTGQIPAGTHSLLFDLGLGPLTPPEVLIGNQQISVMPVGSGPNYTIYGANISAWAGQTEELTFSSPGGNFLIDDISFSDTAVPEPSPFVLASVGALLVGACRRFAFKRS
jgi:hypothetical protein